MMNRLDNILRECREVCDRWPSVIVGGGVRDLLIGKEPKDFDVFYLGSSRDQLREAFADASLDMRRPYRRSGRLMAEVIAGDDLAQVCHTEAESVDQLFDETDWNASLFAYDGERHYLGTSLASVRPGQRLRLIKITSPISSLARGFSFADRLSMVFNVRDVRRLCRAAVESPDPERLRIRPRRRRGREITAS